MEQFPPLPAETVYLLENFLFSQVNSLQKLRVKGLKGSSLNLKGSKAINKIYWLYLSLAILAEVIATSTLKATKGFTVLYPSIVVTVGYIAAFYFLSLTLRVIPIGIAYAIWSAIGIVIVTIAAWIFYKQPLDLPAIIGIFLITLGVVVINIFSKTLPH